MRSRAVVWSVRRERSPPTRGKCGGADGHAPRVVRHPPSDGKRAREDSFISIWACPVRRRRPRRARPRPRPGAHRSARSCASSRLIHRARPTIAAPPGALALSPAGRDQRHKSQTNIYVRHTRLGGCHIRILEQGITAHTKPSHVAHTFTRVRRTHTHTRDTGSTLLTAPRCARRHDSTNTLWGPVACAKGIVLITRPHHT